MKTRDEIKKYVEMMIANGAEIIEAVKNVNVAAHQGTVGEKVESWTSNENGPFVERTTIISLDNETIEPGWIITEIDSNNKEVIDKYGNLNQYVIADSVFKNMYEEVELGIYRKNTKEKFIQVNEDLDFETKYGQMSVTSGGYLKVTDLDKISGIQEVDFNSTYIVVSSIARKK